MVCTQRNVYDDGYTIEGVLEEGQADSVFIDVPSPWFAAPHAGKIVKRGGRVCNFSPCIEQVQRTILELSKAGFGDFETIECLQRDFEKRVNKSNDIYHTAGVGDKDVSSYQQNEYHEFATLDGKWHTGYLTFARKFT